MTEKRSAQNSEHCAPPPYHSKNGHTSRTCNNSSSSCMNDPMFTFRACLQGGRVALANRLTLTCRTVTGISTDIDVILNSSVGIRNNIENKAIKKEKKVNPNLRAKDSLGSQARLTGSGNNTQVNLGSPVYPT